jgi:hypothetical protein
MTCVKQIHPSAAAALKVEEERKEEEEEEEIFQLETERGRKRTLKAVPKCANTNLELAWKKQILNIQKPAFFRVPGINNSFQITEDSCHVDIFETFFITELLRCMQNETDASGPSETQICICAVESSYITTNK